MTTSFDPKLVAIIRTWHRYIGTYIEPKSIVGDQVYFVFQILFLVSIYVTNSGVMT